MISINVDAINRQGLSGARKVCTCFNPLWLIATDSGNTDTLNCRYHNHAFYELHIVTGGKLIYGFEEKELTLREGTFAIIPPRCRHKVLSHSKDIGKFTVAFEIDEESEMKSVMDSMTAKAYPLGESLPIFENILTLCCGKNTYKSEQIYLSLGNLLFDISRYGKELSASSLLHREYDSRVFKAKKYIEDNFDVFFTCEEVALYCRISEKQLGRLFKKHEGVSLLDYIHQKKLESVKKLLSGKRTSHREIAETLGFSSAQYYGRFIQRMTGMTPEALRESLANE